MNAAIPTKLLLPFWQKLTDTSTLLLKMREVRIVRAEPGAKHYLPLLIEFDQKGGTVTAFSDSVLATVRGLLPDDSRLEVKSFGQVVNGVLALAGNADGSIAESGLVLGAIEAACENVAEESPFAKVAGFTGFFRRLAATLDELREFGYRGSDLELAAERLTDGELARKLREMARVEREVQSTLSLVGRSPNALRMEACLDTTLEEMRLGRFLVLAGSAYAPGKLEWLQWLGRQGAEIVLVLEQGPSPMFAGATQTAEFFGISPSFDLQPAGRLAASLFQDEVRLDLPAPTVTTLSAADKLAEAEWTLRSVRKDLAEGVPPDSVAIHVRNLEEYAGLLEAAALRHGLKLKMNRRAPLLTNGFVRVVLAAVDFCAGSDVRRLASLAQSSYSGLTREQQAALRSALLEAYAKRDGQWEALAEWAIVNEESFGWIRKLLEWRQTVLRQSATLAMWKSRLEDLIHDLDWLPNSMNGPIHLRSRDARARSALQRVLAQRGSIQQLGTPRLMNLARFALECRRLWADEDVSIPGPEEGIEVVSSAESLGRVTHLYVMGMLEGVFPRRRSEDPILNDSEREALWKAVPGRRPLPNSHSKAREERDEFFRLCVAADLKLQLSHPLTDDERDNVPAFYLEEIRKVVLTAEVVDCPRGSLTPDDPHLASPADERMSDAMRQALPVGLRNSLTTVEANLAVRAGENKAFSPRELRDVLECPFRHMSRHRLRLEVGRVRSRWSHLRKLPQIAKLARARDRDAAREVMTVALEAELELQFPEGGSFDLSLLRAGGKRLIDEWVEREFSARELWPKDPGSLRDDVRFGQTGLRAELPLRKGPIRLDGSAPALSTMGRYNVLTLHESRAAVDDEGRRDELGDMDRFEYGVYLLAMYQRDRKSALEVDSIKGERTLYLLPRDPDVFIKSRQLEGFRIVDLGPPETFFDFVKPLLADAMEKMGRPEVRAIPSDHCRWCDYGELCRSSSEFGEDSGIFLMHEAEDEA